MSKKNTTTVERPNGTVFQVMPDGSRSPVEGSDVDNPPLTDEELKQFKRVPNPKEIRQRLHLTQKQFAIRFHVHLGTLRDWEQGAKRPDTAARSYLRVIEKAPETVMQALE